MKAIMMKVRTSAINIMAIILCMCMGTLGQAQNGWERVITDLPATGAKDVVEMPDGSIVTMIEKWEGNEKNIHLFRFDADGVFINAQPVFTDVYRRFGYTMSLLPDGNLFIVGQVEEQIDDDYKISGMKVSLAGDILWEERYDINGVMTDGNLRGLCGVDGCWIVADVVNDPNNSVVRPTLFKISSTGQTEWINKPIPDGIKVSIADFSLANDGGIYMVSNYNILANINPKLYKINSVGTLVSETSIPSGDSRGHGLSLQTLNEGGLMLFYLYFSNGVLGAADDFQLYRYNDNLELIWKQTIEHVELTDFFQTPSGRSTVSSSVIDDAGNMNLLVNYLRWDQEDNYLHRRYLYTIDADGNLLKQNIKTMNDHSEKHGGLIIGQQNTLISCGLRDTHPSLWEGDSYPHIVKYDSQGNSVFNQINGNVYRDENLDCLLTPMEAPISGWPVVAVGDNQLFTTTADGDGNYNLDVGIGDYQVYITPASEYWVSCKGIVDIAISNSNDTIVQDFGAQAMIECPNMWIDLATPRLRNCVDNTYYVSYCNHGTVDADPASVEIVLDAGMSVTAASIPYTTSSDGTLVFDLGMVGVLECGDFNFNVFLDCDSTQIGQTLCVDAQIFPDSICTESPNWSGASIAVDGECVDDENILYRIENVGDGTTVMDLEYIVIEDHVIMSQGTVNLNPGEFFEVPVAADGSTYRLEVEQEAFHPGVSFPSLSIEGCGGLTPGLINTYVLDDGNLYTDTDCKEIIGSFDPNDKAGYPLGYDTENFIDKNTDLEYLIRFQNVGNDTAFLVVIKDTLSQLLDPATIRPGSSSHPYEFTLEGDGVAKFTFNNIELPDSTTDENGSNGFVEFKIKQRTDNQIGDVIHNAAGIYFDFNDPIITNQTTHAIGQVLVTNVNYLEGADSEFELIVYPNPFHTTATFEIKNRTFNRGELSLFDLSGKLIRHENLVDPTFQFQRGNLPNGIYAFLIHLDGVDVITGKIVVQ